MFHIHTIYSDDGRITLPMLAKRAKDAGIEGLFITDHNTIEGALRFKERFPEFYTVVGEEIMTTSGEVIGLFLKEEIPPGKSLVETIARIRQQGGIVVLPHPYDVWRASSLKPEVYDTAFSQTDAVEVFNCRTFSERHDRRAMKDCNRYNKLALYGADAHFPEEIGRATFELPEPPTPKNFPWQLSHVQTKRDSYFYRGCLRIKSIWGKYSALNLPERCFVRFQRTLFYWTGGTFFTLAETERLSKELAGKIKQPGYEPELVVGIANGGLFPAYHVARALNLPFETIRISHRQLRIGNLDTDDIIGGYYVRNALYGSDPVILSSCPESIKGKKILFVDDDSSQGNTFRTARQLVGERAVEVRTACIRVLSEDYTPDFSVIDHRGKVYKFPRFPWYKYSPEYEQYARYREKWLYPNCQTLSTE